MAKITPAGDADRAFLGTMPQFSQGAKPVAEWSDDYAHRQAQAARRDLLRGDVPSITGGRAHVLTPEHPNRQVRAKLEGSKRFASAAARSKYAPQLGKDTGGEREAPSRPSQRRTERLTGEHRPLLHRRERGESHIPFAENGEIYTRNSERDARAVLRYAADLNHGHGERVVLQVFDCSRRTWRRVFENRGHGEGINANALLEQWRDHGGSLETYLLDVVNAQGTSSGAGRRLAHICQYEITILPRETAAVKQLRQTLKQRH